jgi:hypothetical protein
VGAAPAGPAPSLGRLITQMSPLCRHEVATSKPLGFLAKMAFVAVVADVAGGRN